MNKLNIKGINPAVWVRGIMTIIAAANVILGYAGYHVIPLNENEVTEIINGLIVALTVAVWAWGFWKNNSVTNAAQIADAIMHEIKPNGADEVINVTIGDTEEAEHE